MTDAEKEILRMADKCIKRKSDAATAGEVIGFVLAEAGTGMKAEIRRKKNYMKSAALLIGAVMYMEEAIGE